MSNISHSLYTEKSSILARFSLSGFYLSFSEFYTRLLYFKVQTTGSKIYCTSEITEKSEK